MNPPIIALSRAGRDFTTGAARGGFWRRLAGSQTMGGVLKAVEEVDLTVSAGEVVGLVGESGSGKSTLARMAAGLIRPTTGEVRWHGRPLWTLSSPETRHLGLSVQMVFQNPHASLNPRLTVAEIIGEAPLFHRIVARHEVADHVEAQLRRVGLDASAGRLFPHQFSGGQRQRIGIARALAVRPAGLVCDEPVTALDVSIQAEILNLFLDLADDRDLGMLFISHDLSVIAHVCDRVLVMYLGRIVEEAPVERLFSCALHPYTQALLADAQRPSSPIPARLQGEPPSPLAPPAGCAFHSRCPVASERCVRERPAMRQVGPDHRVACHVASSPLGPSSAAWRQPADTPTVIPECL